MLKIILCFQNLRYCTKNGVLQQSLRNSIFCAEADFLQVFLYALLGAAEFIRSPTFQRSHRVRIDPEHKTFDGFLRHPANRGCRN